MKKLMLFITTLALFFSSSSGAYAYYTRVSAIKEARINVNTSDLEAGDLLSYDASTYISVPDSNRYYHLGAAYWLDDVYQLKVGDSPRIRVILEVEPYIIPHGNYDNVYLFSGAYTAQNVHISKGTFIAADIRNSGYSLEISLSINAIRGQYESPTDANWTSSLGTASWSSGYNDSGYYDLRLYRDSSVVKRLYNYRGNSYNFYPYMTKEGTYYYMIRTVPDPNISGGSSSEWIDSNSFYLSSDRVSDGTGQTDADTYGGSINASQDGEVYSIDGVNLEENYGWITVGLNTYFRYPDKTLATGWLRLEGIYYKFDDDGKMHKGWYQNQVGQWYYLDPNTGAMLTGWADINGSRYYLDPKDYESQGLMFTGLQTIEGRVYYFDSNGALLTGWKKIGDKFYYFYPQGSVNDGYGYLATNTRIGYFYVGADGAWQP